MSGICDTCKTKIRCIAPVTGVVECDFYEPSDNSRWAELFGTPERAAMTEYIVNLSGDWANKLGEKLTEIVRCRDCKHYKPYRTNHYGMMNRCHDEHGHTHKRDESDFCSRGERREQ